MNESPTYKPMKQITKYQSNDGIEWRTENEAIERDAEKVAFIVECFGLEEDQYPNN